MKVDKDQPDATLSQPSPENTRDTTALDEAASVTPANHQPAPGTMKTQVRTASDPEEPREGYEGQQDNEPAVRAVVSRQ